MYSNVTVRIASICAACCLVAFSSGEANSAQIEAPFTYATRYNVAGQVTGTIAPDPDGAGSLRLLATRNTYNSLGQLEKVEEGQLTIWADETISPTSWGGYGFSAGNIFRTMEFTYDTYGRKIKELTRGLDTSPEALVQYSYDSENFVRCRAVRMNKAQFLTPPSDPCALGAEGSQGPDRIYRYTNNIYGQVTQEERGLGTTLQQTYAVTTYAMRSPTSYTDANGNRTELRYDDGYGRVTERWFPSASSAGAANQSDKNKYEYDANGNVWRETKRNGATITNTFDALNRVTSSVLSDTSKGESTVYDYDARGLMLYAHFSPSSTIGVDNVFDGFGRLKNAKNVTVVGATTATRILQYQYDANGNRTQVKHPDNLIFNYTFDGLNRADCVSEGGNCDPNDTVKLVVVEYRSDGKRNRLLRPGGATTNYMYDNAGRLWTFGQDFAGSTDDMTNTLYYNPAGQAVQLTYGNSAFANTGNLNRAGVYSVNGLNQYTDIASASIGYDANGNLTSDAPTAFTYDMENRLASVTNPAGAMKYDPLGRLSEYTAPPDASIQFLYDGDALVAEYTVSGNSSTLSRRYVQGAGVDEPWVQYNGASVGSAARRYLHADHQGSIIAHTNSSGAILGSKLSYDAYGVPTSTNYDRFGYTGQAWLKELGLFYYRARMYHPKLGRFLQTDPIFYTSDMNLYSYVGNDPFNRVDPSGTEDAPLNEQEKRKSTAALRRIWEQWTDKVWPKDPSTGRNQDVSHKKAVADGGSPNDPKNIEPKPNKEHMEEHKQKGDFKRWGARSSGSAPASPPAAQAPSNEPVRSPGSGPGGKQGGGARIGALGTITLVAGPILIYAENPTEEGAEEAAGELFISVLCLPLGGCNSTAAGIDPVTGLAR